jgi:hypothetical protein
MSRTILKSCGIVFIDSLNEWAKTIKHKGGFEYWNWNVSLRLNNLKEKLRKCLVNELVYPNLQAHLQFIRTDTQAKNCKRAYKVYPKITTNPKQNFKKKNNDNGERSAANNI